MLHLMLPCYVCKLISIQYHDLADVNCMRAATRRACELHCRALIRSCVSKIIRKTVYMFGFFFCITFAFLLYAKAHDAMVRR